MSGTGQPSSSAPPWGGLVVISGPSGSGKTTIVNRLEQDPRVHVVITATTRPMRKGEQNGVDYWFLTREEFERRRDAGEFLEWQEVFQNGHLYGTLRSALDDGLRQRERCCVLEIDVFGGLTLKGQRQPGKYVFIAPPSLDTLRARISGRGTESDEAIAIRMAKANVEMERCREYDHVVVNDDLEATLSTVRRLIGLAETS
ncbi:MAG: guanylate kinase [Planctomycetes bacterium]|nr:guanylate kinase [Planctomycetota bacterium]MCC7173013.1 guanylate kinase [Planctomycetota bacterium]